MRTVDRKTCAAPDAFDFIRHLPALFIARRHAVGAVLGRFKMRRGAAHAVAPMPEDSTGVPLKAMSAPLCVPNPSSSG